MTRERAKELLPIIQAFAEGKTIQARNTYGNVWEDIIDPTWDNYLEFRIKPEPRLVPLTFEDDLLGMKVSCDDLKSMIAGQSKTMVYCVGYHCGISYEELLSKWTQIDGSPCGREA